MYCRNTPFECIADIEYEPMYKVHNLHPTVRKIKRIVVIIKGSTKASVAIELDLEDFISSENISSSIKFYSKNL